MPRYLVAIDYTASINYEVEAPDEETAIEIAKAIEEPEEEFANKVLNSIEFEDAWVVEEVATDA